MADAERDAERGNILKQDGDHKEEDDDKTKLFDGYKMDKERIAKLFKTLDVNGDGRIDVKELSEGLNKLGHHFAAGHAEVYPRFFFIFYFIRSKATYLISMVKAIFLRFPFALPTN